MEEKVYHLRIYSISRYLIALAVTLCLSSILLEDYLRATDNKFISILEFLAIFVFSAFVANQLGSAKVKITFTHEAFVHTWTRRYFLSWEKNIKIPWNLVDLLNR
jgi:hypothetical protein